LCSPHTSAGRLPTDFGLRFFVDALLEIGDLSADERRLIEAQVKAGTPRAAAGSGMGGWGGGVWSPVAR
jgi:transcriptional regulator of heat shock response